ncbi:hypothetical protein NC653_011626 [Populus alba x Populus x berolinensis]|uniref:F-box domain-containing protein n=1 Tax=Populus alba x Populus x berolinensis TaxID=444605 RepID=A0AAD6R2R4_9ROSI|nr:hypothetical protein NC653_011626 [Populus alba x Populus x berolinensis]
MCFNGDQKKIDFNISSGVKASMMELEASANKNFQETLGFLKIILARYHHEHHEVKHMAVLAIFAVALDYGFKQEEPYFQLFTLPDTFNLVVTLKFKQEEDQFLVARYVLNNPAGFYKIFLNANESLKLERTFKMLAFVECDEGDLEMATLVADYLEQFFKLVRDKLLYPLHFEICKVVGLLPPCYLTKLLEELQLHIFDLLNINEIYIVAQTNSKLSTLVHESGLYMKKLDEFFDT